MKILSSVFEYPGYGEAWERFVDASNILSDELRKAGIPVEYQDELEKAVTNVIYLETQYRHYRRSAYIPVYTPEELTRRVRSGEEF